jgi:hypothetical protein
MKVIWSYDNKLSISETLQVVLQPQMLNLKDRIGDDSIRDSERPEGLIVDYTFKTFLTL